MKIRVENNNCFKEVDIYSDEGLGLISKLWIKTSCQHKIMYEPTWLGIPIIQYPEDIVMMQELIWKVKPDVIVETGVAHGGTAILYASVLELLGKGRVIGIDIEIRQHNKIAIQNHFLSKRVHLIEGNSIDKNIVEQVKKAIKEEDKVLVVFDSNHSYKHVLQEMELYSGMVSFGSYMVVMDAAQEIVWDIPSGKKEWLHDNPSLAIKEYLKKHHGWKVDPYYNRLRISASPNGFLRRINND